MTDLKGVKVAVVGAGVLGLTAALQIARCGAAVTLYDPAPLGDNASGVAAGMLAPALESGLDTSTASHFSLLLRARDRWPQLLDVLGLDPRAISRDGGLFLGDEGAAGALASRLTALGVEVERLGGAQAQALSPGLVLSEGGILFTPQDWRLSPSTLVPALFGAYVLASGGVVAERVLTAGGRFMTASGAPIGADAVVLATGADAAGLASAAPELSLLKPVKGQILHFTGGPAAGPVVRTPRGYLAPQPEGAIAGATMEFGLSDRATDPAVLAGLRDEAERLFTSLIGVPAHGMAGVRATSPDGLPLVGRSALAPNTLLCVGARRNGWLLAPLAAELIVTILLGRAESEDAVALAPGRFAAV